MSITITNLPDEKTKLQKKKENISHQMYLVGESETLLFCAITQFV